MLFWSMLVLLYPFATAYGHRLLQGTVQFYDHIIKQYARTVVTCKMCFSETMRRFVV